MQLLCAAAVLMPAAASAQIVGRAYGAYVNAPGMGVAPKEVPSHHPTPFESR